MEKPSLSEVQRRRLDKFDARIAQRKRGAPVAPAMRRYLREVRELILLAGVGQETLAGKIATIASPPREGEALPGHTVKGEFEPQRMSAELTFGDGRAPRPVVIHAVAQLYVEQIARLHPDMTSELSVDDVYTHLNQLRREALTAQHHVVEELREQAIAEKRRAPGGQELGALRAERDEAVTEVAALKEQLQQLENAAVNDGKEIARLTASVYWLQDQLDEVRAQLRQRDDELDASWAQNAEQERQLAAGRAHIDQLDAEVAELRQLLGRTWHRRVRQLLSPESAPRRKTPPKLGRREQRRLDHVVEGLLDSAEHDTGTGGGAGGGAGGVATEVRPVELPAWVRTRGKIAVVTVLGVGLLAAGAFSPVFPGPAATRTAFEQCVQRGGVSASDHGKSRRTLPQFVGLVATDPEADGYDINQYSLPFGSVFFAEDGAQAYAILFSLKAADASIQMSEYYDEKIVGDHVVVSIMNRPLRTGQAVDDIVTSCATTH